MAHGQPAEKCDGGGGNFAVMVIMMMLVICFGRRMV